MQTHFLPFIFSGELKRIHSCDLTALVFAWEAAAPAELHLLLQGQRPPGQEEALLQRPDGDGGGPVLQRGAGRRAPHLGEGFSDGHLPGGGEDTGLLVGGARRVGNWDDFSEARRAVTAQSFDTKIDDAPVTYIHIYIF